MSCLPLCKLQSQTGLSATSRYYLNQRDIDSLLLRHMTSGKQIGSTGIVQLEEWLKNNEDQVALIVTPVLAARLNQMDRQAGSETPDFNSAAFKNNRRRYLESASQVIETLAKGSSLGYAIQVNQEDRILSFHSDITVRDNGSLLVRERIRIYNGDDASGNNDIQRGIVRDFPTKYINRKGFRVNNGFRLKEVTKNGVAEPHQTESLQNGIRTKAGSADLYLAKGEYVYEFEYESDGQLIFHPGKDELYWNVNGNGWVFTADSVSCKVSFPSSAEISEYACYTGRQGSASRDCSAEKMALNQIRFSSTRGFESWEGLTIAVAINKGIIAQPGKMAQSFVFMKDNFIIPFFTLLIFLVFTYYYSAWKKRGKDPEKGNIFPQFQPPAGLSPADTGFIAGQKYGSHLFAAALIDFAVKKNLRINVDSTGKLIKKTRYVFERPHGNENPDSKSSYGFDIGDVYDETAEAGKYNSRLKSCNDKLKNHLQHHWMIRIGQPAVRGMFALNRNTIIPGVVAVFAGIVLSFVFLSLGPVSPTLVWLMVGSVVLLIALNIFFSSIMPAYTKEGRAVADHIEGFAMYLGQAEQHVYEQLTPPEKNLELFEKYLPYAIALKLENAWAAQFNTILQRAFDDGYQPSYFMASQGFRSGFRASGFVGGAMVSGLSSTIASASTPPSQSSGGSGGGGSSGGGGGGGGGGGW